MIVMIFRLCFPSSLSLSLLSLSFSFVVFTLSFSLSFRFHFHVRSIFRIVIFVCHLRWVHLFDFLYSPIPVVFPLSSVSRARTGRSLPSSGPASLPCSEEGRCHLQRIGRCHHLGIWWVASLFSCFVFSPPIPLHSDQVAATFCNYTGCWFTRPGLACRESHLLIASVPCAHSRSL